MLIKLQASAEDAKREETEPSPLGDYSLMGVTHMLTK